MLTSRKDATLKVRISATERRAYVTAARLRGMSLSEFIRSTVGEAVDRVVA